MLREGEPVLVVVFRVDPDDPDVLREVDVLVLRDPGGEDVRVAMPPNLGDHHTRHRDHRMRVGRAPSAAPTVARAPSIG